MKILLTAGVALLLGLLAFFSVRDGQLPAEVRERGPAAWEQRMRDVGAAATYAEFVDAYENEPFERQHGDAHLIGALLYRVAGTDGLGVCDASFAFGCYHAFFGEFISDKGTDFIVELADACRKKYGEADTGCTHGIGHGIMEVLGREHLVQALSFCDATHQANPLYGCSSGVFMEYNDAIIVDESGVRADVRQPGSSDMREPCNTTVPEKYRSSCYFEIALWWRHLFGDDFEKIGNLCETIEEASYRNICYRGWGTTVAENSDYTVEKARGICALIRDSEGNEWCQVGVALRFVGTGHLNAEAKEICGALSSEPADDCNRILH